MTELESSKLDGQFTMPFNIQKWRNEVALLLCSPVARYLWFEMLLLMWESPRRGELLDPNGKQIASKDLAKLLALDRQTVSGCLTELRRRGIFSTLDDGTIYNRFMRRESAEKQRLHDLRVSAGQAGGLAKAKQRPKQKLANGHSLETDKIETDEVKEEKETTSAPTAEKPASEPQQTKPPPVRKPRIIWKQEGDEGDFENITEAHRKKWQKAYPALDLDRQLAAMGAWLIANPKKAPKSNWARFIVGWLSRSQDRGGDVPTNKPTDKAAIVKLFQQDREEARAGR